MNFMNFMNFMNCRVPPLRARFRKNAIADLLLRIFCEICFSTGCGWLALWLAVSVAGSLCGWLAGSAAGWLAGSAAG